MVFYYFTHIFRISNNLETKTCKKCPRKLVPDKVRPDKETFDRYFESFLLDLPGDSCFKGGKATYADGIIYDPNSELKVKDTYFMTYHTPLKTSKDYYTALEQARKISDNLNEMFRENGKKVEVFPYSIFYVFYEQYLTMWNDVAISLGLSLLTVFLVTLAVTGLDLVSALMVLYMVGLILINMIGLMWIFDISLNAISLVNLVVVSFFLGILLQLILPKVSINSALESASNSYHISFGRTLKQMVLDRSERAEP